MKAKISGLLVPALMLLLPLLVRPERLAHPSPWLALMGLVAIAWIHPPVPGFRRLWSDPVDGRSGVAIGAGALLVILTPSLEFALRPELRPDPASGWVAGGALVTFAGTALRVWAVRVLGRFFTAMVAVQPGQRVVQAGPYRLVRHPSYAGALIAGLGSALMFQSAAGVAVVCGLMFPIYLWRIRVEERHLSSELGEAYREYCARSWRLFPPLL